MDRSAQAVRLAEDQDPRVEVGSGAARIMWELNSCDPASYHHFNATRNPGAGQDFTDLAVAVQLRLRVAFGLQTLTVKSRLLTGENSVRIRGDPPLSDED